jgi:hypothetical protein
MLKVLLAHVIGDFVIQPKSWVDDKMNNKLKSPFFYAHIGVHFICLSLFLWFSNWQIIGMVIGSHLVIDALKIQLTTTKNRVWLFFADQIAHIAVIILIFYNESFSLETMGFLNSKALLFAICLFSATFVSSIVLGVLLQNLTEEINADEDSLADAGKYIGMLERAFVFGFIVLNAWSAIGFLLAAKSVFRFGDLTDAKNRKLTEYVLIGTLLSFGLATFFGLIYKYFATYV